MVVVIIQARMGSTRLPGKVLKDIVGKPLLSHVVERVLAIQRVDQVIVATTTKEQDNSIVTLCTQLGVSCFRGSEEDVLDRYYQAAKWIGADVIVRITADCPLIDPVVSEKVVDAYLRGGCDYASNSLKRTYPDGLDTEVFSFEALEKAWREAKLPSEREHVTPYIWKNGNLFRLRNVMQKVNLSHLRWCVDEFEDLEFVRKVYERLYKPGRIFLMNDILKLLEQEPSLMDINAHIKCNEGYQKSLQKDKLKDAKP